MSGSVEPCIVTVVILQHRIRSDTLPHVRNGSNTFVASQTVCRRKRDLSRPKASIRERAGLLSTRANAMQACRSPFRDSRTPPTRPEDGRTAADTSMARPRNRVADSDEENEVEEVVVQAGSRSGSRRAASVRASGSGAPMDEAEEEDDQKVDELEEDDDEEEVVGRIEQNGGHGGEEEDEGDDDGEGDDRAPKRLRNDNGSATPRRRAATNGDAPDSDVKQRPKTYLGERDEEGYASSLIPREASL